MSVLTTPFAKRFIHQSMAVRRANGDPGFMNTFSFLNMVDHTPIPKKRYDDEREWTDAPVAPMVERDRKLAWLR